jgi:hypothetical protein
MRLLEKARQGDKQGIMAEISVLRAGQTPMMAVRARAPAGQR